MTSSWGTAEMSWGGRVPRWALFLFLLILPACSNPFGLDYQEVEITRLFDEYGALLGPNPVRWYVDLYDAKCRLTDEDVVVIDGKYCVRQTLICRWEA